MSFLLEEMILFIQSVYVNCVPYVSIQMSLTALFPFYLHIIKQTSETEFQLI